MSGARSAMSWLLAAATTLAVVIALGASWMHHQLLNTSRWTDASVQVLRDPAVQRLTAGLLADELIEQERRGGAAQGLPSSFQGAATSRAVARAAALRALRSHTLEPFWRTAMATTHEQFVRWLSDRGRGTNGNTVELNLQPAINHLATQVGIPAGVVAAAASATGGAQVRLVRGAQYRQTRTDAHRLQQAATLAIPLALIVAALSVLFAPQRRLGIARIGAAAAIGGLIVVAAAPTLRGRLEDGLTHGGAARSVARAIWDATSPDLLRASWMTVAAGVAVTVTALLIRPRAVPPTPAARANRGRVAAPPQRRL